MLPGDSFRSVARPLGGHQPTHAPCGPGANPADVSPSRSRGPTRVINADKCLNDNGGAHWGWPTNCLVYRKASRNLIKLCGY